MIYNRWDDQLTIKAHCGQHKPQGSEYASILVLASHEDDRNAFYFIHSLRSEGGMREIESAALAAPKMNLSSENLRRAIQEAQ